MIQLQQQTVRKGFSFEGKGLHTGKVARIAVKPAPVGHGIKFKRTDLGDDAIVDALAENVSSTARSTTITNGDISVITIEHLMSGLTGMGIDNALIEIDNVEVPILDGSAKPYVDAIWNDGIAAQKSERKYLELDHEITVTSEKTGSSIVITPSENPSFDVNIDFNSKVLGLQSAHWDPSMVYAEEIGVCRTFVFFHEIEFLFKNNLIKGGDLDNALVIVEHPVPEEDLARMAALFNVEKVDRLPEGYLDNVRLHFPNECARHKLLDLLGDFSLVGRRIKGHVTADKSGHRINTAVAQIMRREILRNGNN